MMITDRCLYYCFTNPTSTTHGGHKRLLDICICTQKLKDDLIREEGMDNPEYEARLDRKLARELFHFVRAENPQYRIRSMEKSQRDFIAANLDFVRRVKFRLLLKKKKIRII